MQIYREDENSTRQEPQRCLLCIPGLGVDVNEIVADRWSITKDEFLAVFLTS